MLDADAHKFNQIK